MSLSILQINCIFFDFFLCCCTFKDFFSSPICLLHIKQWAFFSMPTYWVASSLLLWVELPSRRRNTRMSLLHSLHSTAAWISELLAGCQLVYLPIISQFLMFPLLYCSKYLNLFACNSQEYLQYVVGQVSKCISVIFRRSRERKDACRKFKDPQNKSYLQRISIAKNYVYVSKWMIIYIFAV